MSSCGCANDLSGCDILKVVQYTLVSVDPYIGNDARIGPSGITVAITDDMTDADFATYAISYTERRYAEDMHKWKERLRLDGSHDPSQYIRVCFSVPCRYTMPCPNYEKEQVDALRAINRSIKERERGGDLPAKTR